MQVHQAAHRLVVISANENLANLAALLDDLVRARTITDDVAQIDDNVVGRRSREAGLKSFQVAMNIA